MSSDTVTMIIKNSPTITILPGDASIFWGESVQLTASSTGTMSGFNWSPLTNLSDPFSLSPQVKPDQTTVYSITITDINGCVGVKGVTISVFHDIKMPSAFTPNNDGKNDLFQLPKGIAITLEEFSVFDRSGTRLFFTVDSSKGWNGYYNGVPLPVGIYVYLIKGKTSKGPLILKGTVTLIR